MLVTMPISQGCLECDTSMQGGYGPLRIRGYSPRSCGHVGRIPLPFDFTEPGLHSDDLHGFDGELHTLG